MSKKKKPAAKPIGGYKRFVRDVYEIIAIIYPSNLRKRIPNQHLRSMYAHLFTIQNPSAANKFINSKELKLFAQKSKHYYREKAFEVENAKISTYQLQLISVYNDEMSRIVAKETRDKENYEALQFKEISGELTKAFYSHFLMDNFRIITQLSNPTKKYYGLNIRTAAIFKDNPKLEVVTEVYGIPARRNIVKINGNHRPVFQLGKADATAPLKWVTVGKSVLGEFYDGSKTDLFVFIQSHALKRLKERLNLLNEEALNYALWENTHTIKFEIYKGYLLLPFKIFKIKIGYLVANVIGDNVVFRTFLFLTHNSTPEGDLLKKISGLGKHDISYWQIDRLSTFVQLQEDNYPMLMKLFNEAGLKELSQLKDQDFDVDSMQKANIAGLNEYLKRGQQAEVIQAQEWSDMLCAR